MPLSWSRNGKNSIRLMNDILQYVKLHGECLDTDIVAATNIPLDTVHLQLSELAAKYEVMLCDSTRYVKGKEIKAKICRIAGYIPPAKPGAKPKVQITLS